MALNFLNNGYFAGSVGIGTNSPSSILELSAATPILTLSSTAVNVAQGIEWKNSGTLDAYIKQGPSSAEFEFNVGRNTTWGGDFKFVTDTYDAYRITRDQHKFFILGSAKMTINSSGNVGIGTTSPDRKLEVDFTGSVYGAKFTRSDATGSSLIEFANSAGVKSIIGYDAGVDGYIIGTASATNLVVKQSGNVGIGTTLPGYKLSVDDDTVTTVPKTLLQFDAGSIADNGGYNIDFRVSSNNTADRFVSRIRGIRESTGALSQLSFWTESGSALEQRMTIRASGNIGIGTTTPSSKLQVAGGIQMADDTATASATKVGTMRYRTGTEYVDVTGAELVTNGNFATDSDWTKGTGVTIASGVGTWTNTANNVGFTQLITFTANAYYRCNVTVSNYSSGSFRFRYPGISSPRVTANGTYSLIIQANQATNDTLYLQGETNGDANVNLSIDNVSVIEVTAEDASYADMCMQTGSSTYEWVNIVRNTY